MRRQAIRLAGFALLAASCTATGSTTSGTPGTSAAPTSSGVTTSSSSPVPAGPLVLGQPLPEGCAASTVARSQTVAFVADGRAWALDPDDGTLSCLFETDDPGPFAWGPLGDRVVLGDGRMVGLDGAALAEATDMGSTFGWSKPTGKSLVFSTPDDDVLTKLPLAAAEGEPLLELPAGTYEAVAYHPSGLAMAVSVHDGEEPQIFLATNEGAREKRVVVGVSAVSFPSLAFSSSGDDLYYVAEHKGGYVQIHRLDLIDDELVDGWRSEAPLAQISDLTVSPSGLGVATTTSAGDCTTSVAMTGGVSEQAPALPDAGGPTHALGYLDEERLLVGAGGCGAPMDLWVIDRPKIEDPDDEAAPPMLIVHDADAGASRRVGPSKAAPPLPEDLLGELQEFG
jgi:hypothetical protein